MNPTTVTVRRLEAESHGLGTTGHVTASNYDIAQQIGDPEGHTEVSFPVPDVTRFRVGQELRVTIEGDPPEPAT